MPLLDHFHPPLSGRRHWEGIYGCWSAAIADNLNQSLLTDYFVEFRMSRGTRMEDEIAPFNESSPEPEPNSGGGTATVVQNRVYALPAPVAVIPAVFPDDFEIQVFSSEAGPTLVAAIELVSRGNKDREETRRAFAVKCATYLQREIGVIVVDIVTTRHANMHDELKGLLGHSENFNFPVPTPLYATAYRPAHREERNEIDLWREALALGQPLPTLPLAVCGLGCLPIDLEATYMEARNRGRIR